MTDKKITEIIARMTLEEKASLCSGADMWHTKEIARLGIPSVMVSDGPHGLRTQRGESDHLGINGSIEAVCFPAACATAASFDRDLLYLLGRTIADECLQEGVSVVLGPAMNIKRSPLCGRNFEYFSEDPYLCGELAASYVKGVQSLGVGTSIKHFAANNQETDRMIVSADMDERTLREIYLSAFEKVVKTAEPYTVMCSYNKLNGVLVSENKKLLTDVLRNEWGYNGFVMSDWGAVANRVSGLAAGLELEMPGGSGETDAEIVNAVRSGDLDEKILDEAVRHILSTVLKCKTERGQGIDLEADHKAAVSAAEECAVLLKNEGSVLPLSDSEKVVFIGGFAKTPRYQGGGSSHINSFKTVGAWDCVKNNKNCTFCDGYDMSDADAPQLISMAVEAAAKADKAVLFVGLYDSYESEGYDRTHIGLPSAHTKLIEEVSKVQKNTIVVLHNGSPVEMPWVDSVKGILEMYLAGQGAGEAAANLLYGKISPSGKLPESFPLRLCDNPSYLSFPGDNKRCYYGEGIYVGYRYYDKKQMQVLFPFGYGLSYTTFEYSDITVSNCKISDKETLKVGVTVKNTGKRLGKEVVQLYVSDLTGVVSRPERELKGFVKLALEPQESKRAEFVLDSRAFSYYDESCNDFRVQSGEYLISVGKSSRDILLTKKILVESADRKFTVSRDTTLGELLNNRNTRQFVEDRVTGLAKRGGDGGMMGISTNRDTLIKLVSGVPLRGITGMMKMSNTQLDELIAKLNAAINEK